MSLAPPADLTDDPLACALVEAVARKPWVAVHWHALRDRLEEIGKTAAWAELAARLELFRYRPQDWTAYKRLYNRTLMRRLLKSWRAQLAESLKWEREPAIPF